MKGFNPLHWLIGTLGVMASIVIVKTIADKTGPDGLRNFLAKV